MFGSQAIEVLIGVALTMSIVSLAASTIVEMIAGLLKWRARMLEDELLHFLNGDATARPNAEVASRRTHLLRRPRPRMSPSLANNKVVQSLAGSGRAAPSYLSSSAFVDAVAEYAREHKTVPAGLHARLLTVAKRGHGEAEIRATLERHFDEAMERLSGAYKRRAKNWLFAVGLFIAVIGNVSVYHIAESLWPDTATRQAVVQAARNIDPKGIDASDLDSVGATVSRLQEVGVPVGWTEKAKADWGKARTLPLTRVGMIIGWLLTGVLVTLGAQFWFDLLSKLVALRSSGRKPEELASPATTSTTVAPPATAQASAPITDAAASELIMSALGAAG